MWGWLTDIREQIVKDLTLFLRRNVFRSIGTTVAFTLLLTLALLNPWFGSTTAKAWIIKFMIGDGPELSAVMQLLRRDKEYLADLDPGMKAAGYYQYDDEQIVDKWENDWKPEYEAASEDELKQARVMAIDTARERARRGVPPFNPVGFPANASRPSCSEHRPPAGTAYVDNKLIDRLKGFNPGDRIRIENTRRPNSFAIANVVGRDIGGDLIWLNQEQYDAIDGYEATTLVQVVKVSSAETITPVGAGQSTDFTDCVRPR